MPLMINCVLLFSWHPKKGIFTYIIDYKPNRRYFLKYFILEF